MAEAKTHQELKKSFPNLSVDNYSQSSRPTDDYNCIAFAAKDRNRWWWPDNYPLHYWPGQNYSENPTIQDFINTFKKEFGYTVCEDRDYEPDFEKVAIYATQDGQPKHMAKQCAEGKWCSKLGAAQDIKHNSLESLENGIYGEVVAILKRPIN